MKPDFSQLRPDIWDEINRWGRMELTDLPRELLLSVLSDELLDVFAFASREEAAWIYDIVVYVYTGLPVDCWGSSRNVNSWLKRAKARAAERDP